MPASADKSAAILRVVRAIPRGQVLGYGQVARRAGLPGRARLVARVLSGCDADVPWHRVLRSDGRIAFAAGSDGFIEQCRRLQAEGVAVTDGRVGRAQRPERESARQRLDRDVWGPGPLS